MSVDGDLVHLKSLEAAAVSLDALKHWIDGTLSDCWGKKAAARTFHICQSGFDAELAGPFEKGPATDKSMRATVQVPGAAVPAKTLYDVIQALSWIATRRNDTDERLKWHLDIPALIEQIATSA
jgi:hypothetical protein